METKNSLFLSNIELINQKVIEDNKSWLTKMDTISEEIKFAEKYLKDNKTKSFKIYVGSYLQEIYEDSPTLLEDYREIYEYIAWNGERLLYVNDIEEPETEEWSKPVIELPSTKREHIYKLITQIDDIESFKNINRCHYFFQGKIKEIN